MKIVIKVYNPFMNLQSLKKILLFGKSRAFCEEEFHAQMKFHNIEIVREFDADISMVIEGRMMTPYEQNECDALYEKKNEIISIDVLETALAQEIDNDTLLMSLTLSHDKERLKSFLQNSCVSDTLFLKLIKMYKWSGEDFFENDDNRDVSAAFISRFYKNIERNHNVQFATTGFIHLVSQAKNSQILGTILALEPLKFHPKIQMAIAMSEYCDATLQKKVHKKRDKKIDEALSFNKNLIPKLVEEFILEQHLGKNVAKSIQLNRSLFEKLMPLYKVSLAENETLDIFMQKELFQLNDNEVNFSLAQNITLEQELIISMLKNEELKNMLYANPATEVSLLREAYEDEQYHKALSQNENTPIEILYQLNLDSRYERFVKMNAGFGKYIQSENIGWL